jgi:hypothetical protein
MRGAWSIIAGPFTWQYRAGGPLQRLPGDRSGLEMPMRSWLRIAQGYGCLNVITWFESHPLLGLLNFGWENCNR